jgi:hypothetical protein
MFLPQDHGSWVFILGPMLIGIFARGHFNLALFSLIIAAIAAFLLAAFLALGLAFVLPHLIFIPYLVQYYFKLHEKVQVGIVVGMPDILEEQMKAEKVITT